MTSNQTRLACLLIKEHFGDFVEAVVSTLLTKGPQTLRQIQQNLVFKDLKKIKAACKILLQHGMASCSRNASRGTTEYSGDLNRILMMTKYPQMCLKGKEMYGDDAEVIVEELLQKGSLTMVQVVARVTDRLNVAMEAEGEDPIPYDKVKETFHNMVNCRFLERIPLRPRDELEQSEVAWRETRFAIPLVSNISQVVNKSFGQKRRRSGEEEDGGPAAKRQKTDQAESGWVAPDAGIYWRINHDRFNLLFRDHLLVQSMSDRLGPISAEVFRSMLRLNELTSDATTENSQPQTAVQVYNLIDKELGLTLESFKQHVNLICEDRSNYVTKLSEVAGGATFMINLRTALTKLAMGHVESFVRDRYGVKALRVFRMLSSKGQMEPHKIEESAMMPAKETKDICYQLFTENIVSLTEIPRTPDHAPSRTIYLYRIETNNIVRMVLERTYKAALNLKRRWHHETNEHTRILDKQCKVEGIYTKLKQEGVDEEQLQEVEEMLSPVERDQLERVKLYRDKLERSELMLSDTILVLEQFLGMEAACGAEKIVKPKRG